VSRDPFSVEECNEGSGAACGAIFLNKGFEDLLRKKLGNQANAILTVRRLSEAIRYFENSIKRAFNPFDDACDDEYDIPLSGARDMPSIDLEDGYLKLSKFNSHRFIMLTKLEMTFTASFNPSSTRFTNSSASKWQMLKLNVMIK
jgi:hypothetical protein